MLYRQSQHPISPASQEVCHNGTMATQLESLLRQMVFWRSYYAIRDLLQNNPSKDDAECRSALCRQS
jgi:hypothetical protein